MPTPSSCRVVVGADGSEASLRAVAYAATEAARLETSLLVAHVAPERVPLTLVPSTVSPSFLAVARQIVARATAFARAAAPGVAVEGTVVTGSRGRSLVDLADGARLLVLGAHHGTPVERVVTGRLATWVGARAACPVVVVPSGWTADRAYGRVLVGLDHPASSAGLLAAAFARAEERGAELEIVHAWRMPTGYDDVIEARVAQEDVRRHVAEIAAPLLDALRGQHPGVRANLRTDHGGAAHVLATSSRRADLLLLPRRVRGIPSRHLGSTARALLRASHCPVEVCEPAPYEPGDPGLEQRGRTTTATLARSTQR